MFVHFICTCLYESGVEIARKPGLDFESYRGNCVSSNLTSVTSRNRAAQKVDEVCAVHTLEISFLRHFISLHAMHFISLHAMPCKGLP